MYVKIIALAGVAFLLAACETTQEDPGDAMPVDMPMDDAAPGADALLDDRVYMPSALPPDAADGRRIRIGGTVRGLEGDGQTVFFSVADADASRQVRYEGELTAPLADGQEVVAEGWLGADGVFVADTIDITREAPTPREILAEGDRVFFDFDRYDIREDGQATLMRQAALLRDNPDLTVLVSGHCDERGTREYNLALGDRRATAAKNFLVQAGVESARISTISYGKDRPIVIGHTKEAWARNRVAITSFDTKN